MTGVIVVFQDITDNYRMFQRVLLSDIRQKALIQHSPLGVLLINEDGQIMEINNSAVNMLGSPSPEATKRINILNFEPLEKAGFKHDFLNCIQTNSQVEAERKYISKWGKEMYVKYYFNPIILPDTEEKGVLRSIVDVTEQKIAEEREITFTHSLKHLSDTAISFIELSENDDPFHIIGKKLKEFAGLPFILMKRAENSLTYEVVFFSLPDEIEEQFSKSATDLKSFSVSLSDVKKRNISRYFQEVKKDFETYMTEIGGKFTDLYQALSPAQVLAIDFIWESDDFGNATFFLPSHDAMKNIQAIETFINQASLLLQKRETAIRLRQQNDLYMASVNAIADNFFVLDDQLNLVFINNSFKKIVSNFTKGRDIAGLNVFETFPFLGEDIKAAYQKIIDTHKPNAGIFQFDVGPRILFIDSNSVPIVENNKIKYIITTFRDITAQQEYENQIRELKEFNEKIIESIRDGIAVINEQNEIIFTNPAFERILKLGKGSSVGRKWTDMIADIPLDDFAHQSVIDVNNLIRAEMTLKTGRGDLLNALITISPADLSNKTFILLLTDITERKIIESNLLNAKETAEINSAKVTAVIENTSDNIWAFDRDYKIIYINKIFQKEFNETFGVMLEPGVNLLMAVPPPMRLIWKERYDKVLGGERMLFEDIVHTETFDIYIQVSMNPIIKEGLVIGGSCFGSNITPRKLAELELKTAKEKAEESDRLKTAFLSNMSHEIRTPLNSIIGFSYLLYNREVPPDKQKLYLQQINASSQMLLRLIQDIIDISKIEAGQLGIEYSTFDLKLMLQELFQHFSSETAASGKKIAITCSNLDTSLMYHSDFIRIKQVYSNLLSNALKFTESGSIRFGYEAKDDHISFFVKDTGIGIKDEDQAHLFQRFMRIENRLSRDARGTGLGLAICKNIVELLGGSISFESDYQKGTVFTFRLPYKPVDKVRPVKSEPIPKASLTSEVKTLLIAEDDDVNFMFIEEFLSEYGFHIIRAVNGEEVLELLENNPAVDMILMDLQMPVMDGVEATKKIRKKNAGIPIIAQTAYAFSSERKACLDAGCNDYISKPIVQDELLEKIKNCFSK
jgi:PAS domain S-box-containing protein